MPRSPRTADTTQGSTAAQRRGCAVCGVCLSTYNENPTCWTHTLELPWKGPSTRPR